MEVGFHLRRLQAKRGLHSQLIPRTHSGTWTRKRPKTRHHGWTLSVREGFFPEWLDHVEIRHTCGVANQTVNYFSLSSKGADQRQSLYVLFICRCPQPMPTAGRDPSLVSRPHPRGPCAVVRPLPLTRRAVCRAVRLVCQSPYSVPQSR